MPPIVIEFLTSLLAPIIQAAVREGIKQAIAELKDKSEVSKPNEDLQKSWDSNTFGGHVE